MNTVLLLIGILLLVIAIVVIVLRMKEDIYKHTNKAQCDAMNQKAYGKNGAMCGSYENGYCYKGKMNNKNQCVRDSDKAVVAALVLGGVALLMIIVSLFLKHKKGKRAKFHFSF